LSLKNAYPNTFYSHFGSIKIILKDKRNSPPAYLPHIFQIYFIFDLTKRCAAQNITCCVLSAGLLQHLTWCVLSAGLLQHFKISNDPIKAN
jgi:hypothetical protein